MDEEFNTLEKLIGRAQQQTNEVIEIARQAIAERDAARFHLRAVLEQVVQSVDDGSKFVRGDVVDAAPRALEGGKT